MSGDQLETQENNGGVKEDVNKHSGSNSLENLRHDTTDPAIFRYDHEEGTGEQRILSLRTPARRLPSSDNPSMEVRKRPGPPSSPEDGDHCGTSSDENKKQKLVAKSLFGASRKEEGLTRKTSISRRLYGPPPQKDEVLEKFYEEQREKPEEFLSRYVMVEEITKRELDMNHPNILSQLKIS